MDRSSVTLHTQTLTIGSAAHTTFGAGSINGLAAAVRSFGGRRAFLVTDRGLVSSGLCAEVTAELTAAGLEVAVYSDLRPNPGIADIEAGARALRQAGEAVVIGLGGGTSLDGAKAISLAAANDLPIRELDYRKAPPNPGQPVIAVPTTAGTGSETNSFAVIDDHEAQRKFYVGNETVAPKVVILDPDLTVGLPPAATAASGVDALTHSLESLMARNRNPYARALDLQVIEMVHRWLPVAMETGDDLEARAQMLLAAHLAGLAFATTGLGLVHALGHTLSAQLGTAHGVALAVVLPSVMEVNLSARTAELAQAGVALSAAPGQSEDAAARAAIELVRVLMKRLGMPTTLTELGLKKDGVPGLVRGALDDVVLANNPVHPTTQELTVVVESLL